jgi:LacI family transcriptional regulator
MKDVAAVAKVGLATVSRVLNGNDAVDPQLARRVHDAVELLGYRRDVTASALRRADRQSASVGLVIDDVANPFFSAVLRGFQDVAFPRGVLTLSGSSDGDVARERQLVDSLASRGVDGLVIVPSGDDQTYLARERDAGTALVFVDRPPRYVAADAVVTDNAAGTFAAVEHLAAAGHRRIGYLGDRQRLYTGVERVAGYRRALAEHGLAAEPALERLELADSDAAYAAALDLLAGPDRPSALVTGQNLITLGTLRALRDLSLQHAVALVAFDDVALADVVQPAVTVIAQDPSALGRHAAELLFERLDGESGPPRHVVVPTRLIARGSGEIPPD